MIFSGSETTVRKALLPFTGIVKNGNVDTFSELIKAIGNCGRGLVSQFLDTEDI